MGLGVVKRNRKAAIVAVASLAALLSLSGCDQKNDTRCAVALKNNERMESIKKYCSVEYLEKRFPAR